jgi:hypothetical protein
MAWGKVTEYEVYENMQKVAALDRYLAGSSREPTS